MQFELEFLKALQSISNPVLDFLFELVTMLAEDIFLIAVITFIFWNVSKEAGKKIENNHDQSRFCGICSQDLFFCCYACYNRAKLW